MRFRETCMIPARCGSARGRGRGGCFRIGRWYPKIPARWLVLSCLNLALIWGIYGCTAFTAEHVCIHVFNSSKELFTNVSDFDVYKMRVRDFGIRFEVKFLCFIE